MYSIKKARLAAGLTQKKAAELLGVPFRTFQDWEYGVHRPPKYTQQYIISKLLGMIK